MKKKKILNCFDPRLDWLSVIGDTPHIERERDEFKITETMNKWGFIKLNDKTRLTYRSETWGIEVSFMLKRRTSTSFIKIEFQGQYFATKPEICNSNIMTFIDKCWAEFGVLTPPKATRIDMAIDVIDSTVREILPDISNPKFALMTNTKKEHKPKLTKFYSDESNIHSETGMSIFNSRYQIVVYNRTEKLTQYAKKENKQSYCKYYNDLYSGLKTVHRIELRLHKELCDYFNIQLFSCSQKINDILPECLAFFHHHHKFITTANEKPIAHLENLFSKKKYKSIKQVLSEKSIEMKSTYTNAKYYNINPSIKYIAKFLISNGKTNIQDRKEIMLMLKLAIDEQIWVYLDELKNEKKTFELFKFNFPNQMDLAEEFLRRSAELKALHAETQIETSEEREKYLAFTKEEDSDV